MGYKRKEVTMRLVELIPLVMAFLTAVTNLVAALVQLQTAKTAAQATKKRANRPSKIGRASCRERV